MTTTTMATDPKYQTSLLTAQHSQGHIHLILGANPLAASRATQSLASGAKPILISSSSPTSQLHYAIEAHIAAGRLTHLPRPFEDTDLFTLGRPAVDGIVDAVFVTSARDPLAPHVSALCMRHRIPVNVVDSPALCSFSLLSVHVDGPLQIGVTTNGRGCKLASRIRREVAGGLPRGLGDACARLGDARRKVLEEVELDRDGEEEEEGGGGVDDSVEQGAGLNRLVTEADRKTRRIRWLAQVCEYWPLRRLAGVSDQDVEGILRSYESNVRGLSSSSSGDGGSPPGRRMGRVVLAGSGPGHPDLLTRATHKAIMAADLVLADKLVPAGVLDLIPRRTEVRIARKFPGNADQAQDELLETALAGVKEGKTVLRLKQGDPFVYGRGGEEVSFFRAHGVEVTVLPGITSSLSAPLFAGIPATQRDVADQVLICTGTGKKGKPPVPPEFVGSRTVVFLMALHRISGLVRELTTHLEEEGEEKERRKLWPVDTPCAVVERASCPDQRVIRTTLRYVAEAIEQEGSRPPGLLVVGRACEALYTPERGRFWVVEDGFKGLDLDLDLGLGVDGGERSGTTGGGMEKTGVLVA
ncbi:siroheme synthase [Echria macrotheca]|uniref:Siroheme synthase n=1 Tax=Echria macrotheca TaxID=438768 RepID=A0AAJ0BIP2_9PEZI|nr:siroheme synthase [Echria macrotheca]